MNPKHQTVLIVVALVSLIMAIERLLLPIVVLTIGGLLCVAVVGLILSTPSIIAELRQSKADALNSAKADEQRRVKTERLAARRAAALRS